MLYEKIVKSNIKIIDALVMLYIMLVFTIDRNYPAVQLINILVAVISVLIIVKKKKKKEFVYNTPLIFLFLFSIYGILSSFWSLDFMISLKKSINIFIKTFFIFLLYNNYYKKENLNFLIKSYILAATILCIYQIMDYGLLNYIKMYFMDHRIYSDILNVNELGLMVSFAFLLSLNYIFDKKYKYIFPAILFFIIIIGTCSKTSYILIFVGTLYLFFKKGVYKKVKLNKWSIRLISIIAILFIFFGRNMINNFIVRVSNMVNHILGNSYDVSTSERIELYVSGFKLFLQHPILGSGLDTSRIITSVVIGSGTYFHSDLIEMLACTGMIGFSLFYAFPISILIINRKNNKNKSIVSDMLCFVFILITVVSCIYSNKYRFFLLLITMIGLPYKKLPIKDNMYTYAQKIIESIYKPSNLILRILKIKIINRIIPDKLYLKIIYRCKIKSNLNFSNPKSFNEKLQWLKVYDHNNDYIKMVDKYEVRNYIKKIIGNEYLIPLLEVYNSFDEIDFSKLPNQFVIKCNHDSGGLVICKDKNKFNVDAAKRKINKSLKTNYYYSGREWPYKSVKPKILIEKYMEDETSHELIDYKFMCFNGEPKIVFTCTERFSKDHLKVTFFDLNWNKLPFERHYKSSEKLIKKPINYDKMLEFSKKLSKNIPFVRVDWYEINGKLCFGELTFYPGSGMEEFSPVEWDYKIGELIKLPNKVKVENK